jgi:hypothetical protein
MIFFISLNSFLIGVAKNYLPRLEREFDPPFDPPEPPVLPLLLEPPSEPEELLDGLYELFESEFEFVLVLL